MFRHPVFKTTSLIILLSALSVNAAEELNPIAITEWEVPYSGHPRDPFATGNDQIWFVGQRGHYLGKFIPSNGKFFKKDLPDNAGPHNIIVGANGIVWYTGNLKGHIGRYDPINDKITKIMMPDEAARDPHTMIFSKDKTYIWFTVQRGNFVGRLTIADLSIELIPVPTRHSLPYGIRLAPDGSPWIALLGTNKIAMVNPDTLKLTELVIPHEDARPRRLEITGDGRIWYADYRRGVIGGYDPETKSFREWPLSAGNRSRPYGMAMDNHDNIWVVETGLSPNLFVGFDTKSEKIFSITPIPSGAGSVRHMDYHAPTDSIWFGTDEGTLGRALVGKPKQG
jgi:virginiamycin B lyase